MHVSLFFPGPMSRTGERGWAQSRINSSREGRLEMEVADVRRINNLTFLLAAQVMSVVLRSILYGMEGESLFV